MAQKKFFDLYQKTVWDWLDLLIVPILLAVGGFWISYQMEQQQREIANERYQQELLRGYLDQISQLLIEHDLKTADEFSDVKVLAQSISSTTLRDLDKQRRNSLMLFLRSTGLAAPLENSGSKTGILSWADLSNMDLSGVVMNAIDLRYASLENSNLTDAYLGSRANLSNARFINTSLENADFNESNVNDAIFAYTNLENVKNITDFQLSTAKLCNTKMPDGSESDRDCEELSENYTDYEYSPDHSWDHLK